MQCSTASKLQLLVDVRGIGFWRTSMAGKPSMICGGSNIYNNSNNTYNNIIYINHIYSNMQSYSRRCITVIPMPTAFKIGDEMTGITPRQHITELNSSSLLQLYSTLSAHRLNDEEYWEAVFHQTLQLHRSFGASDIANIFIAMKRCNQRNPEVVQLLNKQLRRLMHTVEVNDIKDIAHVYQEMKWTSKQTIRLLANQFTKKIGDAGAPHVIQMATLFPRLRMHIEQEEEKELYRMIGEHFPAVSSKCTPKEYSLLLNSFAKLNLKNEKLFEFCTKRIVSCLAKAQPEHLALIINAYAKFEIRSLPLLRGVSDASLLKLNQMNSQDMSNILNAFAKLDYINMEWVVQTFPKVMELLGDCTSQGLANIANAYSKMGIRNEKMFERIAEHSMKIIQTFTAQGLGNLCNAFARFNICNKSLMSCIADEVLYRGTVGKQFSEYKFDSMSLDQLVNAFGKLGLHDERVFYVLSQLVKEIWKSETTSGVMNMDGQSIVNIVYGFGKSRLQLKSFYTTLANRVISSSNTISVTGVMLLLNAFKHLSVHHRKLYTTLLRQANKGMQLYPSAALISVMHSLARLDVYNKSFIRNATKQCQIHLAQLSASDCSILALSYAELRHRDVEMMKKLAFMLTTHLYEISNQNLVNSLYAFAKLRFYQKSLFDVFLKEAFQRQHQFTRHQLIRLCYSLALIESTEWNADVLVAVLMQLKKSVRTFSLSELRLMQCVSLYLKCMRIDVFNTLSNELKEFVSTINAVEISFTDHIDTSSSITKSIGKYFTLVSLHPICESQLGPFQLDFMLTPKCIVEVDGPYSYYKQTTLPTAVCMLKHNILKSMGYTVLHIPYHEWEACTTRELRLTYIASFWKRVAPSMEAITSAQILFMIRRNFRKLIQPHNNREPPRVDDRHLLTP